MKNKFFVKIFSLALTVLLLFIPFSPVCIAADTPNFYIKDVSNVTAGTGFMVEICFNTNTNVAVNGIGLTVSYDKTKLKYTQNSMESVNPEITDITSYGSNEKVKLVWDSLNAANLKNGRLFYMTFEALEGFSDTQIAVEVNSLYVISNNKTVDVSVSASVAGNITGSKNSVVLTAEQKISSIGEVELTEECRNKIDDAWNTYSALSAADRNLVSNYDVLVAAMKEYKHLENAGGNTALKKEINEYKAKHEYALELTKDTVTNEKLTDGSYKDIVALEKAIEDMSKLSIPAQAQLLTTKYSLKGILSYLQETLKEEISEADKAEREAAKKAAAQEAVNEYNNLPTKWVFDLTVDTVDTDDETGVREALTALQNFEINEYAIEMLADKREFLNTLLDKIEQLKLAENPEQAEEIIAANEFREKFFYVLGLTPETVTADDALDVNIAYYMYELLDDSVKAHLTQEGDLLESLLAAIENLPEENTSTEEEEKSNTESTESTGATSEKDTDSASAQSTVTESESASSTPNSEDMSIQAEPQKEVEIRTEYIESGKNYSVKFLSRGMSKSVWILLIIDAVLFVNLCICYGFYTRARLTKGGVCDEGNFDE